jgi:MoaA/NifB/PqqE/SkfB family radical SAM enzyme
MAPWKDLIQGNIDEPPNGAVSWSRFQIRGWALPITYINHIKLSVYNSDNGQEPISSMSANLGTQIRADLATAFPCMPDADKGGFNVIAPVGDIEGVYDIVVEAISAEGYSKEIGRRKLVNSREAISHPPKFYHIGFITQCNLSCLMCPAHGDSSEFSSKGIKIDPIILDAALSGLKHYSSHIQRIGITDYGEPFLYSDIFEAIDAIHQACPKAEITMFTNGTLLSDHIIEKILNSHISEIGISLDAGTKQTFETIRFGANFEQVLSNIKALVDERNRKGLKLPRISTNFVLLHSNIRELASYTSIAAKAGVDSIGTINPHGLYQSDRNKAIYKIPVPESLLSKTRKFFVTKMNYSKIIQDCIDISKDAKIPFKAPNFIPNCDQKIDCLDLGRNRPYIVASGDVYPCCVLAAKGSEKGTSVKPMGNIKYESIQQIWESDCYSSFREAFFRGKLPHPICSKCPRYYDL